MARASAFPGLLAVAVAVVLSFSPQLVEAKTKEVQALTYDTFEKYMQKNDIVMVDFYADWCSDCKEFSPKFEKAYEQLQAAKVNVKFAKVDIEDSKNANLKKYLGKEIPTIKVFRKGDLEKPVDYSGAQEVKDVVDFMKEQARPVSTPLTAEEVPEVLAKEKGLVVGIFPSFDTSPEHSAFWEVAESLRGVIPFRHTTDPTLLPREHPAPESLPVVRVLKPFEEGYNDIKVSGKDQLQEAVLAKSLPTVVDFLLSPEDMSIVERAYHLKGRKLWVLFNQSSPEAAEFRAVLTQTAKTHPDAGITFHAGEIQHSAQFLQNFNLGKQTEPCIFILSNEENGKWYRTNIEPSGIEDFVASFLAGKEENRVKSQAIPKKNEKAVKILVAKQFKELVFDSGKNVYIMFYDPDCGYCKETLPVFKAVAEELAYDKDIMFAKMDMTRNDLIVQGFEVDGYPTMYYYTSQGEKLKYGGKRDKEAMVYLLLRHKTPTRYTEEKDFWDEDDLEMGQPVTLVSPAPKDEL